MWTPPNRRLLSLVCVLSALVSVGRSVPLVGTDTANVNVQLVGESYSERDKRSVDSVLPQELQFQFHLSGTPVNLRLRRQAMAPITTLSGIETGQNSLRNSGVYKDMEKGSSMIVKRDTGDYKLTGSFIHQGKGWKLEPLLSRTKRDHHNHTVTSTIADTIPYGSDYFEYKYPNPQIVDVLGVNKARKRKKRWAADKHVVELSFIADHTDYMWFFNWYGERAKALEEMELWYNLVANEINIRYDRIIDSRIKLNTVLLMLYVLDEENMGPLSNVTQAVDENGKLLGGQGLYILSKAVETTPTSILPVSDHYMYFTQLDLKGGVGTANKGTACTFYGVSICENTLQGNLGTIATHEIAHSLKAKHDEGVCSDDDQFVMSSKLRTPVLAGKEGNPWAFSPCSVNDFATYLNTVTCTEPANTKAHVIMVPDSLRLSRDDQCRMKFKNSTSHWCQTLQKQRGVERLCSGMYCDIPWDTNDYCVTIMPQEFTTCADNKWCIRGNCVDIPEGAAPGPDEESHADHDHSAQDADEVAVGEHVEQAVQETVEQDV